VAGELCPPPRVEDVESTGTIEGDRIGVKWRSVRSTDNQRFCLPDRFAVLPFESEDGVSLKVASVEVTVRSDLDAENEPGKTTDLGNSVGDRIDLVQLAVLTSRIEESRFGNRDVLIVSFTRNYTVGSVCGMLRSSAGRSAAFGCKYL